MKTDTPTAVYLKDYRPPEFLVEESEMTLELDFRETKVTTRHRVRRNDSPSDTVAFDIDSIAITAVRVDNVTLDQDDYRIDKGKIHLSSPGDRFTVEFVNIVDPESNKALSGLYRSGDMLCTQCEAEGFRRIAPAVDRPDNLARFRVTLVADRAAFPVLLSNGNLIDSGDAGGGRHFTTWYDPFPKPTYLFAVVAGPLSRLEDTFTTRDGRKVDLHFYARGTDIDKCHHAMASLKRAMTWDEEVYGRIYDLDLFNVVAVSDFNMGAMENKSLNVFNTKYVLADSTMATDADYRNVEAVIGHEYFHNWSGNRVTCRDWFQLSLKEGFTVFRDQEFSADMGSRAVKRIDDVNLLRSHQFREDAGPMAHPVRPDSYVEINNFYTATVYNKGAEVVRMLHTLLGAETFRRGTDLYFDRHDGEAVTTDDFVAALETVSGQDLTAFKRWYSQAGTPTLRVEQQYDPDSEILTVTLTQDCPDTPGQSDKAPFVMPVRFALYDRTGKRVPLGDTAPDDLLVLDERSKSFRFHTAIGDAVTSVLGGFSAPVIVDAALSNEDLALLLACDEDPFNRWEAGQALMQREILGNLERVAQGESIDPSDALVDALKTALENEDLDAEFRASLLTLPTEPWLGEQITPCRPREVHLARKAVKTGLAERLVAPLATCHDQQDALNRGEPEAHQVGARSLRDACLAYLATLDDDDARARVTRRIETARCMTDSIAALAAAVNMTHPDRDTLLEAFYRRWHDEPLVIDKWLRLQATVPADDTLERVSRLTRHESFDYSNPNKVYALLASFAMGNPYAFHAPDENGYRFIGDWVMKLDELNPQVTARLAGAYTDWRRYESTAASGMKTQLTRFAARDGLSADVGEIVSRSLAATANEA